MFRQKACNQCGVELNADTSYIKLSNRLCRKHFNQYVYKKKKLNPNDYRFTEQGKKRRNEATQRARIKHREKWIARARLRYAVKLGIVQKPTTCEKCNDSKIQGHHHKGYDKENELKVQWLCVKHHSEIHRQANYRNQ